MGEEYYKENTKLTLNKKSIIQVVKDMRDLLFPGYFSALLSHATNANIFLKERVTNSLITEMEKINKSTDYNLDAVKIANTFVGELPNVLEILKTDLEAAYNADPAALDYNEIIIAYPGYFAITVYRLANILYKLNVPYIPRVMSEYAHSKTGIDIHPGATIGPYFFIDHGTGIVIGETTIIGSNVKIYQNVTLGALSLGRGQKLKGTKRHPTIKDNVTIYSNATILGGNTTINENVTIGANAFITDDIEANNLVYLEKCVLTIKNKDK